MLIACNDSKKESKPAEKAKEVTPPPPQVKKPVDTAPLPPLAADPGGATGKAVWATGFGGLGIDSPRAITVAANGEVYVVGYFDGEIDMGPGGKHEAPRKGNEKDAPSDAYLVKLGADGSGLRRPLAAPAAVAPAAGIAPVATAGGLAAAMAGTWA